MKIQKPRNEYDILAAVFVIFFLFSMLPLVYCAFFDYATGDDLGYGAAAHRVIAEHGGIGRFFSVIAEQVITYWRIYQGTWSSIFLFSIQPGIWGERFYVVTPFIAMFCIIGGTGLLFHELLVKRGGLATPGFLILWMTVSFYMIQYMPTIRGGMYWYTSVAHYIIPYGVVCVSLVSSIRFITSGGRLRFLWILVAYTYLGGGGYPAIVISLLGTMMILWTHRVVSTETDRYRLRLILIPLLLELTGFAISAVAPGNKTRGGADFGFGFSRAALTIINALKEGVTGSAAHFIRVRPLFLLIPLTVIVTMELANVQEEHTRRFYAHPVLAIVGAYLVISAVYTPQIYAGVEVSGGVPDTIFFVLVLTGTWLTSYLTGYWKMRRSVQNEEMWRRVRYAFFAITVLFVILTGRFLIGNTADYTCITFIKSGGLKDFRQQMEERLAILEDDTIRDAVVYQMNDYQGPYMHMPLSEDPDSFTNAVTKSFYGKDSVIAIPRGGRE